MNPVTLRFEGATEARFLEHYYRRSRRQIQVALALGLFLYAIFGVLDYYVVPDVRQFVWIIRYAIVTPIIIAALTWSFFASFHRFAQLCVSIVVTSAGLGVIVMIGVAPEPGNYLYHLGLVLVLAFLFAFSKIRFIPALSIGGLLTVVYGLTVWLGGTTPPVVLINNGFFMVNLVVILAFAAYSIERYERQTFLDRETIEARTRELERKNEELERSAKRAELIFSAFSDALPGTVLENKYRLEEKIGAGGFGTVYRARHLMLDAPVAVKVFRPVPGADPLKSLERFRLEGISAKRISHRNAVQVHDLGVSAGTFAFLVMELLEGWNLFDEIRHKQRLTPRRCAEIIIPVCAALSEAHRSGIIHRDIKPSNVFLHQSPEGEIVKLVDFGIAKLMDDTTAPELNDLTLTGALIGSPGYMSPERLASEAYDGSADVYGVGVVMYQALSGRRPFEVSAGSQWAAAVQQMTEPPAPLSASVPELPRDLEQLVMRALSIRPADRPGAWEMACSLARMFDLPSPIASEKSNATPLPYRIDPAAYEKTVSLTADFTEEGDPGEATTTG